MPADSAFRLSTYLALALACLCIGYAESTLMPEVAAFAVLSVALMFVLYRNENRYEYLSIPAANRLGLVIMLLYFAWALVRVASELKRPDRPEVEVQLLMIMVFGPLLILLMPAKLARREKHVGDYWGLHAAALCGVALSGALAENAITFALAGLYACAAVWSLTQFYLSRVTGSVPPIPNRPAQLFAGTPLTSIPTRRGELRRALFLVGLALSVAFPLYFVTPRSSAGKLDFGKTRVEIGYSADQMTDLNQVGELKVNPDVAFEVLAETDGQPKADMNVEQRWRGQVLRRYFNGRWQRGDNALPGVDGVTRTTATWAIPRLGHGQCTFTFSVPKKLAGRFLADPVVWAGGGPPPVATFTDAGLQPWTWAGDGSFYWKNSLDADPFTYVQAWRPESDSDLSPPFHIIDPDPTATIRPIIQNPVPRVKEYADALVTTLIRKGELPADCRDRATDLPRPLFHDRIARAFTTHLSTTSELTYTTNLRRDRKDLDPVEEFLFHTKAGHCERFASSLALMLRSQGIPAVLVLGFKGCEPTEEPGKYAVKQEHAHAWVDALIVEFTPAAKRGIPPISRWRSLDPTPSSAAVATADPNGTWASDAQSWVTGRFDDLFGRSTPEKRRKTLTTFAEWATRTDVLVAIAGGAISIFLLRRGLRRQRRTTAAVASLAAESQWFGRLLSLLASHGFTPAPGETPREFAAGVADVLRTRTGTSPVADVPSEWATAYYEARFGGIPLTPNRTAALEARLTELKRALSEP